MGMTKSANSGFAPRSLFRTFAFAEGITWTLLILGMTGKYLFATPEWLVISIGGIHGAVFLAYASIAALVGVNQRWGFWKIVLGVALAIIPYATIPFELGVEKRGQLIGEWRREHSGHVKDDHWFDRLYRWFINRPVLLATALVLFVVVIFAALLVVGPPGGWPKQN
jgi:integral membrane protein